MKLWYLSLIWVLVFVTVSCSENEEHEAPRLGAMTTAVRRLCLAWFFTGNGEYAGKAAELLRGWFGEYFTWLNVSRLTPGLRRDRRCRF